MASASEQETGGESITQKQRQKRWTPRTRTGCISCRRRHVKCDETKPTCRKCASLGIVCAGYSIALTLRRAREASSALVPQPNHALSPFPQIPEIHERQLFYFFRHSFVLTASTVFESEFWSRTSLLACQQYPAAWHAALAIAAFFRQVERCYSVKIGVKMTVQQKWLQDKDERLELEHCNQALRCLIGLDLSSVSYANQEMVLITSLLLTRYYRLRAKPTEALLQVKNGLKLITQWGSWQCRAEEQQDAHLPSCVARVTTIWAPFMRHYLEIYGSVLTISAPLGLPHFFTPRHTAKITFNSFNEAYEEVLAILMSLRYACGSNILMPARIPYECRKYYRTLYCNWKRRFYDYQHSESLLLANKCSGKSLQDVRLMIVKLYEQGILLYLNLDASKGSLAWDDVSPYLGRIISWIEDIIDVVQSLKAYDEYPVKAMMCMVPMISDLLQTACSVARDQTIFSRALLLLKKHDYRSGFFGSCFVAQLLETKAEVEQTGWCLSPMETCDCQPDVFVCSLHRVELISPLSDANAEKGCVRVAMRTNHDIKVGFPGGQYMIPCFSDSGIENFR